jgi:pentatricopeptide repeat protein
MRQEIPEPSPPEPEIPVNPNERKRLSANIRVARSMIDKSCFPKGSFGYQHFLQAKDIFDCLARLKSVESTPDTVNLSLDLWKRVIEEINFQKERSNFLQLIGMDSVKMLLKNWGILAKEKPEEVPSPQDLAMRLLKIARAGFHFSDVIPGILMGVLVDQNVNNKRTLPFLAESLMKIFRENALPNQITGLEPNVYVYARLIKTWADSGRPEVLKKIDKIFKNMSEDNVPPNIVCYTIFLKISAQKASVVRIDRLLESMKNQRVELDGMSINEAIYGYVRGNMFDKANELFDKLLDEQFDYNERAHFIFRGAQRILIGYKNCIDKLTETEDTNRLALAAEAQHLFTKVDNAEILSKDDFGE